MSAADLHAVKAVFTDSEAQALANFAARITREWLRQLPDAELFRAGRMLDALRVLRVALHEAGFSASGGAA